MDLKLREQMQTELKAIQREVGITFIFVTHDQEEALTMSDRVAVFNNGRIEQIAAPARIYESPATEFVASFVGTTNLLSGQAAQRVLGRTGTFSLGPEKIVVRPGDDSEGRPGMVDSIIYLGSGTRYGIRLNSGDVITVLVANQYDGHNVVPVGASVAALLAGALLAFGLSFDEIIVTTFTAGPGI